jgi:hypothetical protein
MLIQRKKNVKDALFVHVIESHGTYNPVTEKALNAYANVISLDRLEAPEGYVVIEMMMRSGDKQILILVDSAFQLADNQGAKANHEITLSGKKYTWSGNYKLIQIKN